MVDISICMVSVNCWDVLENCMKSVQGSLDSLNYEIIIVDNHSSDDTPDRIRNNLPNVRLIENDRNVGFTVATNQAIKASSGKYILWLNTDTILHPRSLKLLYDFMENNPRVGIVGPKVLNEDGTFQPQCKRGLPTPLSSMIYMTKLYYIVPANRVLGNYFLSHLPIDSSNKVVSVSGCCLLARRAVWDEIGPLDENIYGFGEDLDWCMRVREAGWEVWYYPKSVIMHLKGKGGVHVRPYCKIWWMHHAMWVIYRKHFARWYNFILSIAVLVTISFGFIFSCFKTFVCGMIVKVKP